MYYDGFTGGSGLYFSPYNGPIVYSTPILSVDDSTLREYIKKQIEYYFSDENLQKDFFLRGQVSWGLCVIHCGVCVYTDG
jgi:la-related protein 1